MFLNHAVYCTVYSPFQRSVLPLFAVPQLLPHTSCTESVQLWTFFLLLPVRRIVILNGENTSLIAVVACLLELRVLFPSWAWAFFNCIKMCVVQIQVAARPGPPNREVLSSCSVIRCRNNPLRL